MNHTMQILPNLGATDWPRTWRLLSLIVASTLGCTGNVIILCYIVMEAHNHKRRNILLCCTSIADLLVTLLIFPASALLLLGNFQYSLTVCKIQWSVALVCLSVCLLAFSLEALESTLRMEEISKTLQQHRSRELDFHIPCLFSNKPRTYTTMIIFWSLAWIFSLLQITLKYGFDYCGETESLVQNKSSLIVMAAFVCTVPGSISVAFFVRSVYYIRRHGSLPDMKHSAAFHDDREQLISSLCSFIVFVLFWAPFFGVLFTITYDGMSVSAFYITSWIGILKSCVSPYVLFASNAKIREKFVRLLQYCLCKRPLTVPKKRRNKRRRKNYNTRILYNKGVVIIPNN